MYRCPLCLQTINIGDRLIRYCHQCDELRSIEFSPSLLAEEATCGNNGCNAAKRLVGGVFFSHWGCSATSPFWKSGGFGIPGELKGESLMLEFDQPIGNQRFIHWQINLLGRIAELGARISGGDGNGRIAPEGIALEDLQYMFYPKQLLAATESDKDTRTGYFVALAGVPGAGKTVLAFQALSRRGYLPTGSTDQIELQDFIYSESRDEMTIQPMLQLLYVRSLMSANKPFAEPESTLTKSRNLYALFVRRVENSTDTISETIDLPITTSSSRSLVVWSKGIIQRAWSWFLRVVWMSQSTVKVDADNGVPWLTLAMYDVAGEDDLVNDRAIEHGRSSVDKVALVVDATDLIGTTAEEDEKLAQTAANLRRLLESNKTFCVVLTKMDIFIANVPRGFKLPPSFGTSRTRSGFYKDQVQVKAFLNRLLNTQKKSGRRRPNYPHNRIDLLNELIKLDESSPIFFVENTNLSETPNAEVKNMPVSIGLDSFVCWCLEVDRSDIISG